MRTASLQRMREGSQWRSREASFRAMLRAEVLPLSFSGRSWSARPLSAQELLAWRRRMRRRAASREEEEGGDDEDREGEAAAEACALIVRGPLLRGVVHSCCLRGKSPA